MRMLACGQMPKEIAAELSLSIKAVSTFRRRILKKMMMKSNAEVMPCAMENGLVDTHPPAAQAPPVHGSRGSHVSL
jgi:DNA-binding NarL/FixJ family response regulator